MDLERIKYIFLFVAIGFLAITVIFTLYRAVKGPRLTDTLLGVNVINVKTVVVIVILAEMLNETYLVDIALIYSILGFIGVTVLSKLIIKERYGEYTTESLEENKEVN